MKIEDRCTSNEISLPFRHFIPPYFLFFDRSSFEQKTMEQQKGTFALETIIVSIHPLIMVLFNIDDDDDYDYGGGDGVGGHWTVDDEHYCLY